MKFEFSKPSKYVNITKKMSELPPNIGTPEYFVDHAERNFKGRVEWSTAREDIRLQLVRAVGGAGGIMLRLYHNLDMVKEGHLPIALIGKGVCFDSGGYNLKTNMMHEMKFDKCGGMAVYSVLRACANQKYPLPVVGYIPLVNNLIGKAETLPGSVIETHYGKKVEIRDTDAEGRLVLADAIEMAKSMYEGPSEIVTVATLTGSCMAALGEHYHGMFSVDTYSKHASTRMKHAAHKTGDMVWEMPLNHHHLENLQKTKCADILNYNKKELGGSSAAAFLSYFVEDTPWVHLDIAGTAWKDGDTATGRPTELLLKYLELYAEEHA